ncbi:MAG TPA: glycosyltransferase family 39 protein [Gammaproteobacteria bacterium]|nr:glycosyltransferase family 39 protein [Gammaproteobacteria bacterium]
MRRERVYPLIWFISLSLLAIVSLWARPLLPVDETRYISVAWEMWLRGDFLVPFKNGLPYSHKPPMLFWLIHAGWSVFGVNEWWPRILPSLFSFASLLLTSWLARQLWPERPRLVWLAPTMMLASMLWLLFSTAIMFDILLSFWVLLAIAGLLMASRGQQQGWFIFSLGIAAGILTKGPVMILHVLPLALLAPWWSAAVHQRKWRWYGFLVMSVSVSVLLVLMWALPAARSGGDAYAQAIFWGQTAGRVANSFAHQRAWWWYLPVLPVILFPWLLWPASWKGVFQLGKLMQEPGVRLVLAWLIPVFIAFSLISGKQVHYLLPVFPAFILLIARGLQEPVSSQKRGLLPVSMVMVSIGLLLLYLPDQAGLRHIPEWVKDIPSFSGWLVIALGLVIPFLGKRYDKHQHVMLLAGGNLALVLLLSVFVLRQALPSYDLSQFSQRVAEIQNSSIPVAYVGTYHDQFQFSGRLHQPVDVISRADQRNWIKKHPDGRLILNGKRANDPLLGISEQSILFRNKWMLIVKAASFARVMARKDTITVHGG